MNQENDINTLAKIKIKPLRYTLMELRKMNYLKRRGKPIPLELLNKPFEDFDVSNQIKIKRRQSKISQISKISNEEEKMDEIKEDNKESSDLSNTPQSNEKSIENKNSIKSSEKENGILQLKFCEDDENEKSNNKGDNDIE